MGGYTNEDETFIINQNNYRHSYTVNYLRRRFTRKLLGDARRSQASADHPIYKYYTTVTVEDGDTLWTLADAYMDDQYQNKREFITEVKQLNQIDENRIHEGTQLVIPYYSAEYL